MIKKVILPYFCQQKELVYCKDIEAILQKNLGAPTYGVDE